MKHLGIMALALALEIRSAMALPLVVTASGVGNDGETLHAKATFEVVGSELVIQLSNEGTYDPNDAGDILTALFFDVGGNPAFTRIEAKLKLGSSVKGNGGLTDPGGVVGGEWAYKGGLSGAPHGAKYGVSSAGFGLFGPGDRFPGADLQPPASPDGVQYGVTTLADTVGNDNGSISSSGLIKNGVVFRLGNLPDGFTVDQIANVSFQYGTGLDEINLIPEPTGFWLVAGSLAVWFVMRRRV
jgi:hypothetical protein